MKRCALSVAACLVLIVAAAWIVSAPRPRFAEAEWRSLASAGSAEAGRRLFFAGGCASCHATPGQPDPLRLGGGLELKTPFGSFFAPNISPDRADGVGAWRDVDLANALLSGVSRGGDHLYPAFPYTSYQRMTPGDVADLVAFLRLAPPVPGRAPPHKLPFPFSIRRAVGLWKVMYFDNAPLRPDAGRSAEWRLGRYLVEGPGHCGECHTPRGWLGATKPAAFLAGAPAPDGRGKAPSLVGPELARWSKDDIVDALSSGFTPTGDVLGASMTATVRNLSKLPPSDREAIAVFLKSLSPGPPP